MTRTETTATAPAPARRFEIVPVLPYRHDPGDIMHIEFVDYPNTQATPARPSSKCPRSTKTATKGKKR